MAAIRQTNHEKYEKTAWKNVLLIDGEKRTRERGVTDSIRRAAVDGACWLSGREILIIVFLLYICIVASVVVVVAILCCFQKMSFASFARIFVPFVFTDRLETNECGVTDEYIFGKRLYARNLRSKRTCKSARIELTPAIALFLQGNIGLCLLPPSQTAK